MSSLEHPLCPAWCWPLKGIKQDRRLDFSLKEVSTRAGKTGLAQKFLLWSTWIPTQRLVTWLSGARWGWSNEDAAKRGVVGLGLGGRMRQPLQSLRGTGSEMHQGPSCIPRQVLILNLVLPGLADKAQYLPPQTLPLSILVSDPPHRSSWVSSSPSPCLSLIPGLRS